MEFDSDYDEEVKTIEVKIKNPFKTVYQQQDYDAYLKGRFDEDGDNYEDFMSIPLSNNEKDVVSFITITVLDKSIRRDQKDYELYCLRNTKKFFIEFLSPRFSEWLIRITQANLQRRVLTRTVTQMTSNIIICIGEFLARIDGLSIKEDVYKKSIEWLLPSNSKSLFTNLLIRVFHFSACCFRQVDVYVRSESERKRGEFYRNGSFEIKSEGENSEFPKNFAETYLHETFNLMSTVESFDKETAFTEFLQVALVTSLRSLGRHLIEAPLKNLRMNANGYGILTKEVEIYDRWTQSLPFDVPKHILISFHSNVDKDLIDHLISPEKILEITVTRSADSTTACDLLRCLICRQNGYGRDRLITNLSEAVTCKMLHIGVPTSAILSAYASAVESLKALDESCFIMHRVCSIIKTYLKKRTDTVREIITYITTDKNPQMAEQMAKRKATVVDEEETSGINDEFLARPDDKFNNSWKTWQPDPPDALPGESTRFQRSADVFTMLVSVYGSKESFVKEYRQSLSERLIQSANKDPSFEQRYLELLKLRFSEGELQHCEVMLKDVNDSRRINKDLAEKVGLPISTRIVSSHYWPKVDNDKVEEYPALLEEGLAKFANEYKSVKMSRNLNWIRSAGCVEITLNIDGVEVEKVASHANAAVIYLFLENDVWTPTEISEKLNIGRSATLRRLEWWQSQGVLVQGTSDQWTLTSQATNLERFRTSQDVENDNDSEDDDAVDATDVLEELEQYWNYTKNFIGNHENKEVKPDRLYMIYKMFMMSAPPTMDHVITFLQRKVRQNLLQVNNGYYRVVKEDAPGNV